MTATVPDVEAIEHLDFDPAIPCGAIACLKAEVAQPATQVVVARMPCHTDRTPICDPCRTAIELARLMHALVVCGIHESTACAHNVFTFGPLP